MTSHESVNHPLEFAYQAAKRLLFPDVQIDLLRKIALRYAKSGTAVDSKRGLAILEEARLSHRRQMEGSDYHQSLEYPAFAIDFHALGLHDQALWIISESVQIAGNFKPKYETSMLIMVAEACHSIGERGRCQEVLVKVEQYLRGRKRLISHQDERFDVLLSLYLKLGLLERAKSLGAKMTGIDKADALAAIAFYGEPKGRCYETCLYFSLRFAKRNRSPHTLALVAGLLAKQGMPDRARDLIASIDIRYISCEAALNVALAMLETGDTTGALAVLEEHCGSPDTFFYFHADQLKRLVTLLLPDHADVVADLIGRVWEEARECMTEKDRLLRYSRMVGLVAPHSQTEAEELVDLVLNAPLADLDRRMDGTKFFYNRVAACILFELAMGMDQFGLCLNEERSERFRDLLASMPVCEPRRYMDRFRPASAIAQSVAQ